jgi:hypothetical protein
MLKRKEFDATEEAALRDCVAKGFTIKRMVKHLGWCDEIIYREIRRLGLRHLKMWDDDDDAILARLSERSEITRTFAVKCFNGKRTLPAIKSRAAKLGITLNWASRDDFYGDDEDAIIRANILVAPIADWKHLLHGRTERSIRDRSRILGFKSPFIVEKEARGRYKRA